jgi:hypothetical protein
MQLSDIVPNHQSSYVSNEPIKDFFEKDNPKKTKYNQNDDHIAIVKRTFIIVDMRNVQRHVYHGRRVYHFVIDDLCGKK